MTQAQTWHWPPELKMVIWSAIGAASNRGWADMFTETTGRKVRLALEPDTVNRFKWTASGMFHLVAGFTNETSLMLTAERDFAVRDAGPFPVRIVWSFSKSNSGFFTGLDAGIKTPADIKPGTKIVDVSSFLSSMRLFKALLAWAQVDYSDIDWVSVGSAPEMADAVAEGRADVGFAIPTSATAQRAEAGARAISWIEMNPVADPAGAARFGEVYPLINFGIVPEGTGAVPSAVGTWCTEGINYFVTREATDPELVYQLAKWFDQNYEKYCDRHPDNRFRSREVLLRGMEHTFIPAHPGLIKYLREQGDWNDARERRQGDNERLVSAYCAAYQEALEKADEAAIMISPGNEEWTQLWAGQCQRKRLPPVRLYAGLTDA
jgi:TRAP-type uncharacterized transport system substrate-binding protein